MTSGIGFNSAIDYSQTQRLQNYSNQTNPFSEIVAGRAYSPNWSTQLDSVNLSTQNKDQVEQGTSEDKSDGKIGFWGACKNLVKGVGKSIVNGVKGMFTNKEGKFSLGKTLLSVGTAALCIAFPAVGLAACAVGAVAGTVQVVKGGINVAKAETDAQAEQAWQDIGGGAFTVAASVVGAKAGVKAVKATSTAGANGASALSSLDDAATFGQKASALVKDMGSSTKNQFGKIKNSAVALNTSKKNYKQAKAEYKAAGEAFDNAKKNGWTDETYAAADDLKIAQDKLLQAEANYKYSGIDSKVSRTAQKAAETAKHPIKAAKAKIASNASKKAAAKANAANTANVDKATFLSKLKEMPANTWKSIKNLPSKTVKAFSDKGKVAWKFLTTNEGKYAEAVQKFGYDAVYEVLFVANGYAELNDAI